MRDLPAFVRADKVGAEPLRDMIDAMTHARCTDEQFEAAESYLLSLGYRTRLAHAPQACVYVIGGDDGPTKVGISSAPLERLQNLQIGSPFKLSLFAQSDMAPRLVAGKVERLTHRRLRAHALKGEWFSCGSEIAIPAMRAAFEELTGVGDVI